MDTNNEVEIDDFEQTIENNISNEETTQFDESNVEDNEDQRSVSDDSSDQRSDEMSTDQRSAEDMDTSDVESVPERSNARYNLRSSVKSTAQTPFNRRNFYMMH